MANARKVIFSTYVIPTQIKEMEEANVTHEEFQSEVGKTLGGKGTAIIDASQWGDKWTSATHGEINKWEEFTDVNWEDVLLYPTKSGRVALTDSATQLSTDSNDCAFLYIKNLGLTNEVLLSLQGNDSSKYLIIIPPEGSINIRGAAGDERSGISAPIDCNDIYVKCSSSKTTEIEYLIAKG
tara:strand:+ start:952 stop:1497 length:546 start_codon:yes stop_codon:yes gene_type:complete